MVHSFICSHENMANILSPLNRMYLAADAVKMLKHKYALRLGVGYCGLLESHPELTKSSFSPSSISLVMSATPNMLPRVSLLLHKNT